MGFPIRHPDRDRIREALFVEGIYPPVHWDLRGSVPEDFAESHRLAGHILTLLCDQRYGRGDMERMTACVRKALT